MATLQGRTLACMAFYNMAGSTMKAGHLGFSEDMCWFPLLLMVGLP